MGAARSFFCFPSPSVSVSLASVVIITVVAVVGAGHRTATRQPWGLHASLQGDTSPGEDAAWRRGWPNKHAFYVRHLTTQATGGLTEVKGLKPPPRLPRHRGPLRRAPRTDPRSPGADAATRRRLWRGDCRGGSGAGQSWGPAGNKHAQRGACPCGHRAAPRPGGGPGPAS